MRIVSLLPSSTEILFAVGAGPDVVGVTVECNYPAEARSRRIVSTTTLDAGLAPEEIDAQVRARVAAGEELYRLDRDALRPLDPDLVVTQDLCAVCALDVSDVTEALGHLGCRAEVLTVDPRTLDAVLESIATIASAAGRAGEGERLVARLRGRLDVVAGLVRGQPRPRVAVLEWTDPAFSAGHWIPDMVSRAGGEPVLGASGARSVPVGWEAVAAADPDVVIVAPCGFGLEAAADQARGLLDAGRLGERAEVWAIDADSLVVRAGPRLVDGVEALAGILHPDVAASPSGTHLRQRIREGCRQVRAAPGER